MASADLRLFQKGTTLLPADWHSQLLPHAHPKKKPRMEVTSLQFELEMWTDKPQYQDLIRFLFTVLSVGSEMDVSFRPKTRGLTSSVDHRCPNLFFALAGQALARDRHQKSYQCINDPRSP